MITRSGLKERNPRARVLTMTISGFIWLESIVDKLASKHAVSTDEVLQIFEEEVLFRWVETGLHENEDVYSALGRTHGGRYLIVFFVYKTDERALVISAREMTASEKKRYAQR